MVTNEMLIDTHVHMSAIESVEPVIQRARAAGVGGIVAVGMDRASCMRTLEIAGKYPGIVFPAVGYHPWEIRVDEIEETLAYVEQHLGHCVALGEVGLDYKVKVKKPIQRDVFSKCLRMAADQNRPVIVHSRYSHQRTYRMVVEAGIERAVFHWYSGPADVLNQIVKSGYHVSATPALAYSPPHRAAMEMTPLKQILIETDAPVEYRGKISEPSDLIDTLRLLGDLKGVGRDVLGRMMTENAKNFFNLHRK